MKACWRLLLGPLLALLAALAGSHWAMPVPALITLSITALCVGWWVVEAVPVAATALLPLALFPLLGILNGNEVAEAYGSPIILLMIGGFMLSKAMERSNAHYHLALMALHAVGGGSERRLVMGFMIASAVLSMWISNTATALMLLPVALALLGRVQGERLAAPLMLGIAYGASIGGIGTPVGTPPNLVFMQVYADTFGRTISFVEWMGWALPVVVVFLPVAGWWLTRGLGRPVSAALPEREAWNSAQRRVMLVFAATVLLWVTRQEPFGGWSALAGLPGASDASVALLAAVSLFVISDGRGGRLMDWPTAVSIPWEILILFGGGICIAKAFVSSGLSGIIAGNLEQFASLPLLPMLFLLCLSVTFLTEATSNTASSTLLMPVLAAAAIGLNLEPELLMIPAAISASCAFTLPIATPPNAIVYGSGHLTIPRMAREGVLLSVLGAVIISAIFTTRFSA